MRSETWLIVKVAVALTIYIVLTIIASVANQPHLTHGEIMAYVMEAKNFGMP